MTESTFKVEWFDLGREALFPPDPLIPDGLDLDLTFGRKGCVAALPYPARGSGIHYAECTVCGANILIAATGRADDPKTIKMPCRRGGMQ